MAAYNVTVHFLKSSLAAFTAFAVLGPLPASAQDEERSYAGVSVAFSDEAGVCQEDDDRAGHRRCIGVALWRIFGGYHFNRHFALEGALHAVERTGGGALELAAVGSLPSADDRVALYGRVGAITTGLASSETALVLAAGVRFNVSDSFGLRFEWQGYRAGGSLDLFAVGAFLRF